MKMHSILVTGALVAASFAVAGAANAQSSGTAFSGTGGKAVFDNVCAACHMPGAVGYPGAYPALAKNPKLAAPAYPALVILKGQGQMPALGRMFDDQQISDVVNYVRSNFGNSFPGTVTPAEVAALRK